jgi:hypothetical protein
VREDMAKVLVERPRTGRSFARVAKRKGLMRREQRGAQADTLPSRESLRGGRKRGRKDLAENLAPLWRLIAKRVGRGWDHVYAELRERVDGRNAVQAHILQHIFASIDRAPILRDGRAYRLGMDGLREITRREFFVDARGILRRGKGLTYRDLARARAER